MGSITIRSIFLVRFLFFSDIESFGDVQYELMQINLKYKSIHPNQNTNTVGTTMFMWYVLVKIIKITFVK